jgi:hypothetical protein
VFLSAIGVVVILILINLASWLSGLACYNSLYERMPRKEATAIMQQNGYNVIYSEYSHHTSMNIYSRNKLEPPIELEFHDGVLTYKDRTCPPDYFLQSVHDRLHRYSR